MTFQAGFLLRRVVASVAAKLPVAVVDVRVTLLHVTLKHFLRRQQRPTNATIARRMIQLVVTHKL